MSYSGNYTALLIRRNRSVRVLASGVDKASALASINSNWQHRNHPENVHNYVLLTGTGAANVAQVIEPTSASTSSGPVPKRVAIV